MSLRERLSAKKADAPEAGPPELQVLAPVAGNARTRAPAARAAEELAEAKGTASRAAFSEAKAAIHATLLEKHADKIDITDREGVRSQIAHLTEEHLRRSSLAISRLEYGKLIESLLDEVLGLGPLQPLLEDPEISEVMINHARQVFVERAGRLTLTNVTFDSDRQLKQVINRIVSTVGRRVDESSPMCDARLPDGSRVNVVLPPLTLDGPCMTIRKFSHQKLLPDDLLRMGSATPAMMRFLQATVRTKLNVLVSGGTSSGKTTLLNILSSYIPAGERVVTIEDAAELQLIQQHVIRMEARPPNVEGKGAVAIRDLVRNSLRMRPDRIVVGECRGGEALDMLQAMNTGHEGSMSTIHANSAEDALSRLETMVLMSGAELPSRAIRKQIASAIDLVVQTQRLRGGARRMVSITEISGFQDGEIVCQELFQFRQLGIGAEDEALGYHTATGAQSVHVGHLEAGGEVLPADIFEAVEPRLGGPEAGPSAG